MGENSLPPCKPALSFLHEESLSKVSADNGLHHTWAIIRHFSGTCSFSSGWDHAWCQYQQLKSTGLSFSSGHPSSPKKIELFSRKRQSPPENKSMLCLEWKPSHGYPVPTVFPAAKPDGFLLCPHSHFLPITRKLFSEKMDKNRGLELGNLKTNRKIRLWSKEESKTLARAEWRRMDFYFFLFLL